MLCASPICTVIEALLLLVCCALITFLTLVVALRLWLRKQYRLSHSRGDGNEDVGTWTQISVGFFHPYCNAGGGGERVLWSAVQAIQKQYPHARCIVYTGDQEVTPDEIHANVKTNFNIVLEKPVHFVYLNNRHLVEARRYPNLTLLCQSLGSVFLGLEAIVKFVPSVYLDTMGYAFTLPIFKYFGGCKVGCYVHYPTVSTDMLEQVARKESGICNSVSVSRSPFLSRCKLIYYRVFAKIYGSCGRCADVVMVNSSWTDGHISRLWNQRAKTFVVYPPCDVGAFEDVSLDSPPKKDAVSIISVAQFRPEKDHPLQIRALQKFLSMLPADKRDFVELVLVGSSRNRDDAKRVEALRMLSRELGVESHVKFQLNVSFSELKKCLRDATVGLHTMWNEHFGIGVVECMAAGVIVLAHNSGGPKMDIVVDYMNKATGFLASNVDEYAEKLLYISQLSSDEIAEIQMNARKSVQRFSGTEFSRRFLFATQSLMNSFKKLS